MEWIKTVKLQEGGCFVNGNISIPKSHKLFKDIEKWSETNNPEPQFLDKQLIDHEKSKISNNIQKMLDKKAQSFRYDDINSIGKYLGFENQYRVECEKLGSWACKCWKKSEEIEISFLNGDIPMPTLEEVMAQMPTYE